MAEQTWEEIVASANLDAGEAKLFEKFNQKVPEFKKGWMRQSEFSRGMNDIERRKKDYETAIEYSERMKGWADENVPKYEKLQQAGAIDEDGNLVWLSEREELKKQIAEARAQSVSGAEMDPAELKRRVEEIVKDAGGVSKAEMTALVASEAARMANEVTDTKYKQWSQDFNEKTIPYTAGFSTQMGLSAIKYEKETGEEFTEEKQKELYALMAKEQDFNPRSAMNKFMKPLVDKRDAEKEIERRVQERLKNVRTMAGGGDEDLLPVEGNQKPQVGAIKKLLNLSMDEGNNFDTQDLRSEVEAAGRKAAQELRSEQVVRGF